jgi:hypothetical protein
MSKRHSTKSQEPKPERPEGANLGDLLVRQVSSLVSATADALCANDPTRDVLKDEGYFYRLLAENCTLKAQLAESFSRPTKDAKIRETRTTRDKDGKPLPITVAVRKPWKGRARKGGSHE